MVKWFDQNYRETPNVLVSATGGGGSLTTMRNFREGSKETLNAEMRLIRPPGAFTDASPPKHHLMVLLKPF